MRIEILAAFAAATLAFCLPALLPAADAATAQQGMASYYKHGKRTASGERYDPRNLTAAHRSLPFGTRVKVTNAKSGRSVVVRINDRGPFIRGRIIDLSLGAAQAIGLHRAGVAKVKIEVLR
jgi:rare lipoprotein A